MRLVLYLGNREPVIKNGDEQFIIDTQLVVNKQQYDALLTASELHRVEVDLEEK